MDVLALLSEIWTALRESDLRLFLIALFFYYFTLLISPIKLKVILWSLGQDVSIKFLYKLSIIAVFVNNLTPMARYGGEPTKIALLKSEGRVPLGIATTAVITEKAMEAIPFFGFLIYAMTVIGLKFSRYVLAVSFLFIVLALFFIIFRRRLLEYALKAWGHRIPGDTLAEYDKALLMIKKKWHYNIVVAILTILSIIFLGLRIAIIAASLGIYLDWTAMAYVTAIYIILGTLGVTPGGVGILDGGLVAAFISMGIPASTSAAIVILDRAITYVSTTIVGLILASHYGGLKILKALKESK